MLETAQLAQGAVKANYNAFPRRTYAVGTSNGGYQVRRAIRKRRTSSTAASTGRERTSIPPRTS